MGDNVSRRDFLKTTSISAAGISAMSLAPLSAALEPTQLSRVVIATDEECFDFNNETVDEARVQDMVDYSIMWLTQVNPKPAAYEALFANGVTEDTTIIIKYNEAKPKLTREHVINALINGLTSMLGGSFPEDNIKLVGRDSSPASNVTFDIDGREYPIRSNWIDCDYFINCPPCWAISAGCGAAMGLKNLVTGTTGSINAMHGYFKDEDDPSLSILNSQEVFKSKQALVLMDAICLGAKGSNNDADNAGYCVLASKDMVAVEYLGIDILDKTGDMTSGNKSDASRICELAAKQEYGLGTNDPNSMELVEINPDNWATGVITPGDKKISSRNIQVKTNPTYTTFSYPGDAGAHATISIYDIKGKQIWTRRSSKNSIAWNHKDRHGHKVSSGMYLYQLKVGKDTAQGKITVK